MKMSLTQPFSATRTSEGSLRLVGQVLERLVKNPQYNISTIWQMQGQNYREAGNINSAINSFLQGERFITHFFAIPRMVISILNFLVPQSLTLIQTTPKLA